jgi:glycosyltransferase involved in cell wall biosynthesis
MPSRIAIVGPVHPYRGGIAHFTEMTAEVLARRGHDVHLVSFSRQYPELLFPGRTQFEPDDEAPALVRNAPRVLDSINPVSWFRTGFHIRDIAPDAVLFQYWMPFFAPAYGVVARGLQRHYGIPSFALVHNALPHERHLFDATLSRYFLNICAGHVVMSDAVATDVRSLCDAPVRLEQIEHPVYERFGDPLPQREARARLGLSAESPVLLFFGFVREYKGLHVLLNALPQIREQLPDVRLVIAGEAYGDPERYQSIIREHGLNGIVDWHDGYVPSDDVPAYFSAADLVVQPYVTATQSGVAQIAFHFETPMVVTDVGGLAEVVPDGDAGYVVPPESPEDLAAAVTQFFVDEQQDELKAGARRQKEKHAPDRLGEAVERLVRR